MSFIKQDEHIIILDYNPYPGLEFTPDELARLREAGVKTVQCYLSWYLTEPKMGEYDWSAVDKLVEGYHRAGIKAIVKAYLSAPAHFPDDWYIRSANGDIQRNPGQPNKDGTCPVSTLSYWNPDAWDYHLQFIERVCERYSDTNTLCINIAPANGEALIPGNNFLFDDHALASYRQFTGTNGVPGEALPDTPIVELPERPPLQFG